MIGLLQRVTEASVTVDQVVVGQIGCGIMVLVGIVPEDTQKEADRLLERLLGYRIFADDQGRMNLSVQDINGGLLLVPQFTLAADTRKGTRPSFTSAAPPDQARQLFDYLFQTAKTRYPGTESGQFGADMQVSLVNDGPVTFWLQS
ncbi:MAG: D-aminoacyl-tRNA deacylase [Gammaproteobacteria bacterium]|nr:D-aminoacyl-tRNA deacylase [Gammaproteobacteria bacterium]